ncbi:hypothetical protein DERP_001928 [Dermatophagoides pteronyssinus]|uniref:Uncharacterized protein n=1 Tax=Dermatophagoides pteronyssinus TaxID=6956 RepID=A0ABQ8JCD1_DERPT|nr:hypothetical protein DERP_001928 [Dermatophagoides pteronyssinus]
MLHAILPKNTYKSIKFSLIRFISISISTINNFEEQEKTLPNGILLRNIYYLRRPPPPKITTPKQK